MDTLWNVREFYAALIGFAIIACDAAFSEKTGELSSCRSIENTDYIGGFEGVNTRQVWDSQLHKMVTVEVLPEDDDYDHNAGTPPGDLNELNTATVWESMRDAHHEEMLYELKQLDAPCKLFNAQGRRLPQHGEWAQYALDRNRRYSRLRMYLTKLDGDDRAKAQAIIWKRYKASVIECVNRVNPNWHPPMVASPDWSRLLLSKRQAYLLTYGFTPVGSGSYNQWLGRTKVPQPLLASKPTQPALNIW